MRKSDAILDNLNQCCNIYAADVQVMTSAAVLVFVFDLLVYVV